MAQSLLMSLPLFSPIQLYLPSPVPSRTDPVKHPSLHPAASCFLNLSQETSYLVGMVPKRAVSPDSKESWVRF